VVAACEDQNLARFEVPRRVALVPEPWTPENGMVTASQKLRRKDICSQHAGQIDRMYESGRRS
jgi:long-chain acyl-CoA synthetase